jgi:hypothetical protein
MTDQSVNFRLRYPSVRGCDAFEAFGIAAVVGDRALLERHQVLVVSLTLPDRGGRRARNSSGPAPHGSRGRNYCSRAAGPFSRLTEVSSSA